MAGISPLQFVVREIIFAHQLIGAAGEEAWAFGGQSQYFSVGSGQFVGFLAFFHRPNMNLLIAAAAANPFVIGSESNTENRSFVPDIGRLEFAGRRVENAAASIAAGGGNQFAVVAPRDGCD